MTDLAELRLNPDVQSGRPSCRLLPYHLADETLHCRPSHSPSRAFFLGAFGRPSNAPNRTRISLNLPANEERGDERQCRRFAFRR